MREYDVNEPVEPPVEMRMPEMVELKKKEYRPKKQELLREYEIGIRFLSIGCIVNVGCKQIPFRDIKEAMDCINDYVNNPYEEGKKWREIFEGEEE